MKLFEYQAYSLLQRSGLNIPPYWLIKNKSEIRTLPGAAMVVKGQLLSKGRGKRGLVRICGDKNERDRAILEMLGKRIDGETSSQVLVTQKVEFDKEYYLSFCYDTRLRGPVVIFSDMGGVDVEQGSFHQQWSVDPTQPFDLRRAYELVPEMFAGVAVNLWKVFCGFDCELIEINPLVVAKDGKVYALDAKIILDDEADFRRPVQFPAQGLYGREPTWAELEAHKIDQQDHRGTAGNVYWDLDGDIAVIAAGGGGSIVNMDALTALGGKPANYTEHSGNPPREKLKKLTKIILSKPGLKGCWFVGGTANFTDIYETLMGFVEGLREIKPKPTYPIVIRRGGPRDQEAFETLEEIGKKEGFDFHIFGRETAMTSTAKVMLELAYSERVALDGKK